MASSSQSNTMNPLLGQPVSEKLTRSNHALWKAQVRATIRGARLQGYLTGATKEPPKEVIVKATDGKETKINKSLGTSWRLSQEMSWSRLLHVIRQRRLGRS